MEVIAWPDLSGTFAQCKVGGSPVVPIMIWTLPITELDGKQKVV